MSGIEIEIDGVKVYSIIDKLNFKGAEGIEILKEDISNMSVAEVYKTISMFSKQTSGTADFLKLSEIIFDMYEQTHPFGFEQIQPILNDILDHLANKHRFDNVIMVEKYEKLISTILTKFENKEKLNIIPHLVFNKNYKSGIRGLDEVFANYLKSIDGNSKENFANIPMREFFKKTSAPLCLREVLRQLMDDGMEAEVFIYYRDLLKNKDMAYISSFEQVVGAEKTVQIHKHFIDHEDAFETTMMAISRFNDHLFFDDEVKKRIMKNFMESQDKGCLVKQLITKKIDLSKYGQITDFILENINEIIDNATFANSMNKSFFQEAVKKGKGEYVLEALLSCAMKEYGTTNETSDSHKTMLINDMFSGNSPEYQQTPGLTSKISWIRVACVDSILAIGLLNAPDYVKSINASAFKVLWVNNDQEYKHDEIARSYRNSGKYMIEQSFDI